MVTTRNGSKTGGSRGSGTQGSRQTSRQPSRTPSPQRSPPPKGFVTQEAHDALLAQNEGLIQKVLDITERLHKLEGQQHSTSKRRKRPSSSEDSSSSDSEDARSDSDYSYSADNRREEKKRRHRKKKASRRSSSSRSAKDSELYSRMEMIEEQFAKMPGAKLKDGLPVVHLPDDPFTAEIQEAAGPKNFIYPKVSKYDGQGDPMQHLLQYRSVMRVLRYNEALQCRCFPLTLSKAASEWFNTLKAGSVDSFQRLAQLFVNQFVHAKRRKKASTFLSTVKQEPGESLKKYIGRFKEALQEVSDASLDAIISALVGGTTSKAFRSRLTQDEPTSLDELYGCADKYINAETLDSWHASNSGKKRAEERPFQDRGKGKMSQGSRRDSQPAPPRRFENYTPLNTSRSDILMQIQGEGLLRDPPRLKTPAERRDRTKYCKYHRDHGHTTDDCVSLKMEIESLIRRGELKKFTARRNNNNQGHGKEDLEDLNMIQGGEEYPLSSVNVIAGGRDVQGRRQYKGNISLTSPTPEDDQPITFSREDLKGLSATYDDSTVIQVQIGTRHRVHRVFIDTGSSADIIFLHCFEKMGVDRNLIRSCTSQLTGFNGARTSALGRITLPLTIGDSTDRQKTKHVDFLIVDMFSAYNVIIGRQTLVDFGIVISPKHQAIKLPTPNGVARVRSNQEVAKKCYLISIAHKEQ